MKNKKILLLHSFNSLQTLPSSYGKIIHDLNNKFENFYIVNTDRLEIIFRSKIEKVNKTKFFNKIKLIDPNNIEELNQFIDNDECLVINGISRRVRYFSIFYYLAKKNIPQIMITNMGHVQPPPSYYQGKFKHILNNFFVRVFPHYLYNLLVFFNIFLKIDIRFISNQNLFDQIKSSSFKRDLSHVKEFKLVNSFHYEEEIYKKKSENKHILLLELPPNYLDVSEITGKFNKKELNEHYLQLNNFLIKLKNLNKKKIIVSISPKYKFKEARLRFKNFKIVNRNVQNYIRDSFMVVFYDSSVILYAALSKKPIINIKSEIYEKRNFKTNLYNQLLNLKEINIYDDFNYNKIELMKDLKKRVKSYNNFFKKYLPKNKNSGNKEIIKIIKKKYF